MLTWAKKDSFPLFMFRGDSDSGNSPFRNSNRFRLLFLVTDNIDRSYAGDRLSQDQHQV